MSICADLQHLLRTAKVTPPYILVGHSGLSLANYGAVEIGVHTFHHPGDPTNIGEAKFITIWQQQKDGKWQVTRAISFDHHPAPKE